MSDVYEIKEICDVVLKKIRQLVPYSSNGRPDIPNRYRGHRNFWLKAMRATNDPHGDLKRLKSYHLNITPEESGSDFVSKRLNLAFFNSRSKPTIREWCDYIKTLPVRAHKKTRKNGEKIDYQEKIENQAKAAVRMGIGNCSEMSALAYILLKERDRDIFDDSVKIERVQFSKDDHRFVIVNRKEGSDLKDMYSWGPQAIILDAWMNEVFIVADELNKPFSSFLSFNYIFSRQEQIVCDEDVGYMGSYHTQHWYEQREKKNEPYYLFDWEPVQQTAETEDMPWYEEDGENSPDLKRRRY